MSESDKQEMKIPSCRGCSHAEEKEGEGVVLSCNPVSSGLPHESCMFKWVGAQLFSMRIAISHLKVNYPPEFQKKMKEFLDRTLEELKEDDDWKDTGS